MKFVLLPLTLLLSSYFNVAYAQVQVPSDISSVYITDCQTGNDFGLNSYYLFNQQPVFNAHSNALQQIEFLLRKISKIKHRSKNSPSRLQHALFIPVSFEPQSWVQQPAEGDFAAAARWVMHNYDYQCAKKLLQNYPDIVNAGPYIVSSQKEITSTQFSPLRIPTLIQDISYVSTPNSRFWLNLFFRKSWQPRQWQSTNLLNLQTNLIEELYNQEVSQIEEHQRAQIEQQNKAATDKAEPSDATPLELIPHPFSPCMDYPVNDSLDKPENVYLKKIRIYYQQK